MDIKQLQYFVVSVNCGSFKKAAEVLYTSQPHISKTIKALETELRVQLLERRVHGVEPTAAGIRVYKYACRILAESGKIQNIAEKMPHSSLRIAANPSDYLTAVIQKFFLSEWGSGLHVEYLEKNIEDILYSLHHHRIDLGFVYVNEKQFIGFKEELKHKRLDFIELTKTGPLLFLGPKNPLYDAAYVTGGELRALKYVQAKEDEDFFSMNLLPKNEDYQYHKYHGQVLLTNSRQLVLQILKESELCSISCGLAMDLEGYSEIRGISIRGSEGSVSFGYMKRSRDGLTEEAKRFLALVKNTINE